MASSKEYLDYVLDLLREAPEITTRKMMGEYMLYTCGRIVGGIYDDRFLVKDTPASRAVLSAYEIPYEGGSPMLLVDIEDSDTLAELVAEMLPDLPEPKKRKK